MNYPIILALNLTKNPQNRGFCALFASETLVFGLFEHKIEVFVLGRAFVFWEWWVLSCILTFVVCLSNFYELFLLKLLLRVCRSILAVALLPKLCCRSFAAVTWLPLISYRGAAAGMLSPLPECYLRRRNASLPPVERRRSAIATTGGTPPLPPAGIGLL